MSDHSGVANLILPLALYFLPTIVAKWRRHNNRFAITVLNLVLGWTAILWVVALVWACTKDVERNPFTYRRER